MDVSSKVISACINQDLEALKQYYAQGVNFNNIFDYSGDSLLHVAIKYNKPDSFNTLVELGINIEINETFFNMTPLNYTTVYGALDFAETLVSLGADVNTQDVFGSTPLYNAMYYAEYNMADYFLTLSSVDVNIPDNIGVPPCLWSYVDGEMSTFNHIIMHPQFDATYNYILLCDPLQYYIDESSEIKHYLESTYPDLNEPLINLFEEVKLFALKYDFSGVFDLSEVEVYGNYHFAYDGYYTELGIQNISLSFSSFYEQVMDNHTVPNWAKDVFMIVEEAVQFSKNTKDSTAYFNKILVGDPVLIPSGWNGHAIGFVIHEDRLYRCNRGDLSDGVHGIEEFIITKPENLSPELIEFMLKGSGSSDVLQNDLIGYLGLELIGQVENPSQIAGNCVWTSLETSVEALFITSYISQGIDSEMAHHLAKQNFLLWENYDLNQTLLHVINEPTLFLENEIYDDLLINILEVQHDPNNLAEIERGVLILNQLDEPSVFATFDENIGHYVLEYSPQSYETVSYLDPYKPNEPHESTYLEIISNWVILHNLFLSNDVITNGSEYLDFLIACDHYEQTHDPILESFGSSLDLEISTLYHDLMPLQDQAIYI